MKQTLLTALLVVASAATSHAQNSCHPISSGNIIINHRAGYLYGKNFTAVVSCSWSTQPLVYWVGGPMCPGRYFYGRRRDGMPFACLVRSIGRRL